MSTKSDSNVRRSSRIQDKSKQGKISYRELEEGKEYYLDDSFDNQQPIQEANPKAEAKNKAKPELKLAHPKKSLTAYTLFVKIKRKELQEKFPEATTPELMKEIGRQWKNITPDEKEWYQNMALKDKDRYKREINEMNRIKEYHNIDSCDLKKPKKCLSSYMIFVRDTRSKVTQEFPDMNALDVMKEVGRRWQNISEEDKKSFQTLADRDKERFKREHQQYLKDLEVLDKKLKNSSKMKDASSGELEKGSDIEIVDDQTDPIGPNGKKMRRDPGMPKKPLSAYIYFSQETREQIKKEHPNMPVSQVMQLVSTRWSKMSAEEKNPFIQSAKEDKKRYEKEISVSKTKTSKNDVKDVDHVNNEFDYYEIDSESDGRPKKMQRIAEENKTIPISITSVNKSSDNKITIDLDAHKNALKSESSKQLLTNDSQQTRIQADIKFQFTQPVINNDGEKYK